jgi:DNA-binding NarL/FixJ family response regulator
MEFTSSAGKRQRKTESPAPDRRRIRTLIVDDSPLVVRGLESFFGQDGEFEVVGIAGTGVEAVERAERLRPELVVMDVMMPEMDGLEATRRIKAGKGAPVVIVFTLEDSAGARARAKRAGADDFVAKAPSGWELLAAAIRRAFPEAKLGGRR